MAGPESQRAIYTSNISYVFEEAKMRQHGFEQQLTEGSFFFSS
jgi:hypothetical protein